MNTKSPTEMSLELSLQKGGGTAIAMAALATLLASVAPGTAQAQSTGNRCLPGTYFPSATPPVAPARCIPAPEGTYAPGYSSTSAIPAPVGTFVRSPGASTYEKGSAGQSGAAKSSSSGSASVGSFVAK